VRLPHNAAPPIRVPQQQGREATPQRSKIVNGILRSDDAAAAADL
jgi:hypothetical protein